MRLSIQHTTSYQYDEAFGYALTQVCLTPQSGAAQTVESWHIKAPGQLFASRDGFGNLKHRYSFIGHSQTSQVQAGGMINTHGVSSWQETEESPSPLLFLRNGPLSEPHPRIAEFARKVMDAYPSPNNKTDALVNLSAAVAERVAYQKNFTNVDTSALEAFDWQAGVCQDQAHVMLAACRSLGLPARYVSGYFYAENEPDLASHAWVEVCTDVAQRTWVSIDVTHSCLIDERHVRIATGLDYSSCPPLKGIRHGGEGEAMQVEICIFPLLST